MATFSGSSALLVPIEGVDDWAWRKGQEYGTILVDRDLHRVMDLLPDRSSESFAAWLQWHPEVVTIARDRCGLYAELATDNSHTAQATRSHQQRQRRFERKDIGAVHAAVETQWSTGQVEGQINRLKMTKRQMYGRAGFELLRARVLPYIPATSAIPGPTP